MEIAELDETRTSPQKHGITVENDNVISRLLLLRQSRYQMFSGGETKNNDKNTA